MSKKHLKQQIKKLDRRIAKLEAMQWWDTSWRPLAGEVKGCANCFAAEWLKSKKGQK
jgi:hypothetical protein